MSATSRHGGDNITIRLTHSSGADDDDELYRGSFTHVNADILLAKKKIGYITALLVNRQAIPEKCFYEAFDSHSADMQWIGCAVMENRMGRTKLQSLVEYDNMEFDFMYIEKFHIDDEHRQNKGSSDVGTKALRLFLHHSFIKGNLDFGCWRVSSAAYVLDAKEHMTRAQLDDIREEQMAMAANPFNPPTQSAEERMEKDRYYAQLERADANPFLRNGFFQDPALARGGGSDARILVASCHHMEQPLKSHAEAVAIEFCPPPRQVTGHDAKILQAVKKGCIGTGIQFQTARDLDANQLTGLVREINSYVSLGGSIFRSNALHAAVANNSPKVVTWILQAEPNAVNSTDITQSTPLMIAAASAAGRSTINGIAEACVMDKLIQAGANKSAQDDSGMTAYGRFKLATFEYQQMMQAMTGGHAARPVVTPPNLSCQDIENKLYPPTGPSRADLSGGSGGNTGLVDYSEQDRQNDREMGLYDEDDSFDDDEGDY